jgi:endonuclease/exonuclease/phosphatase (EEP) superfamily protein YafD
MGFQECEDVSWPLKDAKAAGMKDDFTTIVTRHATAMAYRTSAFTHLEDGQEDVAEDEAHQYYGRRIAAYVRLTHKSSGKPVCFVNHHGPTTPGTGGKCGNKATAFNLLKMIATKCKVGDAIIFVGDFNAAAMMPTGGSQWRNCTYAAAKCLWGEEVGNVDCHMPHAFANPVIDDMWGIDNMFSSCTKVVNTTVMPHGGSDHMALNAVFELSNAATAETVTV